MRSLDLDAGLRIARGKGRGILEIRTITYHGVPRLKHIAGKNCSQLSSTQLYSMPSRKTSGFGPGLFLAIPCGANKK